MSQSPPCDSANPTVKLGRVCKRNPALRVQRGAGRSGGFDGGVKGPRSKKNNTQSLIYECSQADLLVTQTGNAQQQARTGRARPREGHTGVRR